MRTATPARPRRLQYESLERRDMMAALAAKLKGGVLTVTGTDKADTITFQQAGGWIAVGGVNNAWTTAQVNSVVVSLKAGNDVVNLNGLTEDVTIKSGKGSERVVFPNGFQSTFSGSGHTLRVTSAGVATLDGQVLNWNNPAPPNPNRPTPPNPNPPAPPDPNPPAPNPPTNWFDSHVVDAALRGLGSSRFVDGLINRTDMIDLFRSAQDGGAVDATELADLRAIVGNTTLFGALDYVGKLSSYIVSANAANSSYLGQSLGNLAAGSTAAHLEKLVGKWFLGLDHPEANGTYRQFSGQLFVNGASYTDIRQGAVGDCYFVASFAETALRTPAAINNMFIVNGDGTYTVRFFDYGAAHYVTVDSYLPTNGSGALVYAGRGMRFDSAANELWTPLAEKAYVQLNEMGWQRSGLPGSGQNSYDAISGGYIFAALGHITGQMTAPFTATGAGSSFTTFVAAYNQGELIGFASKTTPPSTAVVGSHAYAVIGYNTVTQQVTLYNPWGPEYAPLVLTWGQIQSNFSYFDRTV